MCESPPMPMVLTLRCQHCGKLTVLKGKDAQFARDQFRLGGENVEYGDTLTISTCGARVCDWADFTAWAFSL